MRDPARPLPVGTPVEEVPLSGLLREAYLDPIRTVLVVDDEFPTLDDLVANVLVAGQAWGGKSANASVVRDLLAYVRNRSSPWLVDIHDGKGISVDGELRIAPHLHHTDLMILDYHLNGDGGNGDQAITILRALAANDHFNLVVVYTKGYSGGDLRQVYAEIRNALSYRQFSFMTADEHNAFDDYMAKWEDLDPSIVDDLVALVSPDSYFKERVRPGSVAASEEGALIRTIVAKRQAKDLTIDAQILTKWLLHKKHKELESQMSSVDLGTVTCGYNENTNWVCTTRLFVTVVGKSEGPDKLESKLLDALSSWRPSPHQLLMAKMRSQLDQRGVVAEAGVLDDAYVQAAWLSEMFQPGYKDRKRLLERTVRRHWEALGDQLGEEVRGYAGRLILHAEQTGSTDIRKRYVDPEITKNRSKMIAHVNCYNSTKPVEASHLRTGQVFELPPSAGDTKKSYWICLSPSCDLVPGQKTSGWNSRLRDFLPFAAVELKPCKLETALNHASLNIYLFLRISGEVEAFAFHPEGNLGANPSWEQMFAANRGEFSSNINDLVLHRCAANGASLLADATTAVVVAQLRYEYALNLLQRLGGVFSRVGLDFKSAGG